MNSHTPRKRFGQNFLRDESVIDRILGSIDFIPDETIVEIGPGQGALTFPLLKQLNQLSVIELDRDLIKALSDKAAQFGELTIYNEDALKFDLSVLKTEPITIVGNLPYNISTPLLFHLFEQLNLISSMTFMLQKEVVDRLSAKVNDSNYSRLSVMTQFYCQVEHCFDVPAEAFYPQPKVTSSVVKLIPIRRNLINLDQSLFSKVVKQAFSQRRKVLKNNLKQWLANTDFEKLDIPASARAQELSVDDYLTITDFIQNTEKSNH